MPNNSSLSVGKASYQCDKLNWSTISKWAFHARSGVIGLPCANLRARQLIRPASPLPGAYSLLTVCRNPQDPGARDMSSIIGSRKIAREAWVAQEELVVFGPAYSKTSVM